MDSDSRTPFVRLVNRMIVLLSRARLGMFIVGNVGYFENNKHGLSPHWSRLLEQLRGNLLCESSDNEDQNLSQINARVGQAIPLCCPVHRGSVKFVEGPKCSLGFCNVLCEEILDVSQNKLRITMMMEDVVIIHFQ